MDNEKGIRGFLPCKNHTNTPMNQEICQFIKHYRETLYPKYYGKQHPQLKLEQFKRVHDALYTFAQDNDLLNVPIGDVYTANAYETLEIMADSFFMCVPSNDHNINHFVAGKMLEVRYYDSVL